MSLIYIKHEGYEIVHETIPSGRELIYVNERHRSRFEEPRPISPIFSQVDHARAHIDKLNNPGLSDEKKEFIDMDKKHLADLIYVIPHLKREGKHRDAEMCEEDVILIKARIKEMENPKDEQFTLF